MNNEHNVETYFLKSRFCGSEFLNKGCPRAISPDLANEDANSQLGRDRDSQLVHDWDSQPDYKIASYASSLARSCENSQLFGRENFQMAKQQASS